MPTRVAASRSNSPFYNIAFINCFSVCVNGYDTVFFRSSVRKGGLNATQHPSTKLHSVRTNARPSEVTQPESLSGLDLRASQMRRCPGSVLNSTI